MIINYHSKYTDLKRFFSYKLIKICTIFNKKLTPENSPNVLLSDCLDVSLMNRNLWIILHYPEPRIQNPVPLLQAISKSQHTKESL